MNIIAGDFKQAYQKTVFPNCTQYVKCVNREKSILDHVYCNIKQAYRALPQPHIGQSDHLSLQLIPAYSGDQPRRRQTKPIRRLISTWPDNALSQLKDCFISTEWSVFENQDLEEYTCAVLGYVSFCTENVTVKKHLTIFQNQKPWMMEEVRILIRDRNIAYRSGDRAQYCMVRANLKRGIKVAKKLYKQKIEGHFFDRDLRRAWQGIQHMTNYKGRNITPVHTDALLAEELNIFFASFEENRQTAPPPTFSSTSLTLQQHQVRSELRKVNTRKASGPDGVPGKVLSVCADQLSGILIKILNLSLTKAIIPTCLKMSVIIPVSKTTTDCSLNNFRPIALTSVLMKCFERLVLRHIKACLPLSLDPYQFAYRANRCTEDAIVIALHTALSHLEHAGNYARLLFIDYSSAFNTIIPDILINKLLDLSLDYWTTLYLCLDKGLLNQ